MDFFSVYRKEIPRPSEHDNKKAYIKSLHKFKGRTAAVGHRLLTPVEVRGLLNEPEPNDKEANEDEEDGDEDGDEEDGERTPTPAQCLGNGEVVFELKASTLWADDTEGSLIESQLQDTRADHA